MVASRRSVGGPYGIQLAKIMGIILIVFYNIKTNTSAFSATRKREKLSIRDLLL